MRLWILAISAVVAACSSAADSTFDDSALSTAPDAATDGGGDAADGGAVPTYAEIAPILASTCSSCHGNEFGTLDKVRKKRADMLDLVSSGSMPRRNPTWKDSANGQKLLDFLQNSTEL